MCDPAAELNRFVVGRPKVANGPRVKICGITSERDALMAIHPGPQDSVLFLQKVRDVISPQALNHFVIEFRISFMRWGISRSK